MKNYYKILGVNKSATQEEVKQAYRKLAKEHHPDRGGDAEKFKEVQEAYETISDPFKRQEYDNPRRSNQWTGGGASFYSMDDMMAAFMGRGFRNSRGSYSVDVGISIKLTLEEIQKGVNKKIDYKRCVKCTECHGNGSKHGKSIERCEYCKGTGRKRSHLGGDFFVVETECSYCGGEGQVIIEKCAKCSGSGLIEESFSINIDVPAGVENGNILNYKGIGNESSKTGAIGSLHIQIEEIEHPVFKRSGCDLIYSLKVPFPYLMTGNKGTKVPTLDGHFTFDLPSNTAPGTAFRVGSGELGLPDIRSGGKIVGAIIVQIELDIPKTQLSTEELALMEKLKSFKHFSLKE